MKPAISYSKFCSSHFLLLNQAHKGRHTLGLTKNIAFVREVGMRVCVCVCVRAYVRACVHACVSVYLSVSAPGLLKLFT